MKKKIIFIIDTLDGGGAEKVLIDILNNLDYNKYSVDLLLIKYQGIYLDRVNKNVNIKFISKKSTNIVIEKIKNILIKKIYIKYLSKHICKRYIKNNYDVEIAFLEGPSTNIIANSINKQSKKIAWVHTDLRRLRRLDYDTEKRIYGEFDKIICVSEEVKKALLELYPQNDKKSEVIYNLIDTKNVIYKSNEKVEYKFKGKNVVAIGRLIQSKRFDLIIKAHARALELGVDHNLILLGDGELKQELLNLVKKLNVDKTVHFLGFVNNPYPYIKNSDIFMMASDYEGLPLVICEAMTIGKTIISTSCTGPKELLKHGDCGVLVKCNDYIELSEALNKCLKDDNIRRIYEEKTKKNIYLFDEENIIKKISKLLDEV